MGEQIKYTDLFDGDIVAKIQELSNSLGTLQGEYDKIRKDIQSKAVKLKISISKDGLSFDEISRLASETEKLSKAIKILDDAQLQASKASVIAEKALQEQLKTEQQREKLAEQQLRTEQQRAKQQQENNKLRAEEQETLKRLQADLNILTQRKSNLLNLDKDSIKYAETQAQSYNLLSASYNAVKNALNRFSEEERKGIPVLANMEKQAKAMYEQMNKLQQATGKHTLNVGNYQSAFDGLGWSVRNVVRELPALGINLNTFFLAISNNIPIVIDEIKRFNEEQKKVAEAGTQVQSVGKKIISTVLSWQTLLIVGITILTKYGKQIGEWVVGLFKAKQAVDNLISSQEALNRMRVEVAESTKDEEVELGLIVDRIKEVEKGTDEWRNAIERVNEITDANLSTTTATIGQVEEVTKAYLEQAIQLAKNQAIINQISESEENKIKRGLALNRGGRSADGILSVMGLSYYDKEGNVSKEGERANKYIEALNNVARAEQRVKEAEDERYDTEHGGRVYYEDAMMVLKQYKNTITDFENWVRSELQILDDNAVQNLLSEYKITPTNEDRNGKKGREKTKKDYEDLWRELEEARVNAMKESYEKEVEQEKLNNKLALHDYEETLNEKLKILKENNENKFISDEQYQKDVKSLNQQYDEIIEKQEEAHLNKLQELYEAHQKEIAQQHVESLTKQYTIEEEFMRKRTRNQTEESAKNVQLIKEIEAQIKLINELNVAKNNADTTGAKDEYTNAITQAENSLATLKSKLTIDRRQSNQDPLTEWLGKTLTKDLLAMDDTQIRQVYIQKLMEIYRVDEKEAEKIAEYIGIEKIWADVAEQGINSAEALKDAVGEILNNIGDVANAYMDLADAKMESAQAGVDAAQEAYEKEKALLEAGYANSVETAWAELEEQKKIAKQAEEEQKKAQRVQIAIDTATQAVNLVTGVSEIWKKFAANPILAGILTATMIGGFAASKIMALKAVNTSAQYGDGHVELLDYGGSHASGNDMPLATDRNGRQRRVERGEAFAVFNRRAVQRQGYSKIRDIVDSINKGTYERQAMNTMQRDTELGMIYTQKTADLTKIEGSLAKVVENTGRRTYIDGNGNLVEINGNTKRIIKG